MNKRKLTIVLPCFNEAKRIGSVLNTLKRYGYRILVIDDGSTDQTIQVAEKHIKNVVKHRVNLGKGAAMKTGADIAFREGADYIVFMDADGQHDASELPEFVKKLEEGYEIVFGSRNLGFNVPLVRFLGNKVAAILVSMLFGIYISDILCGYRAISKEAYKKTHWESSRYGVETEMVIRTGKTKTRHCEIMTEAIYFDSTKGVTPLDAVNIFLDVLRWKVTL